MALSIGASLCPPGSPAPFHASPPSGGRPTREHSIAVPLSLVPPASSRDRPRVDVDIDPQVSCAACDAVCCRLTVVLMPEDDVPERLTAWTDEGLHVMARDESGWCVAVDGAHRCSIYETRPAICRKFEMGGPYCRAVRVDYAAEHATDSTAEPATPLARTISLVLC